MSNKTIVYLNTSDSASNWFHFGFVFGAHSKVFLLNIKKQVCIKLERLRHHNQKTGCLDFYTYQVQHSLERGQKALRNTFWAHNTSWGY